MLAPHIKKKVDELWNRFWAAGLTNPLVAVEQITYLLFLKRLEDIDLKRQQRGLPSIYTDNELCRWSYIRQEKTNPGHLIDVVFPWLRELEKHFTNGTAEGSELASLNNRMADAYFQLDPNKAKYSAMPLMPLTSCSLALAKARPPRTLWATPSNICLAKWLQPARTGSFELLVI